jgi:predicted O-methyltransferase YrrM
MDVLGWIEDFAAELQAIGPDRPPAPRWDQDWFPRLDAAAAYAIVRKTKPKRIVEVGSGHSTRFLARAVADGGLATEITCIDPEPRAKIDALPVKRVRVPVQGAGLSVYERLEAGDILFIDSSHQVKEGSDVEFLLKRALPRLESGVRLHFHDIFLPDDYPHAWAWRRYNEQEAVASLLRHGYAEEFASYRTVRSGELGETVRRLPLVPGAVESSFWLSKR